MPIFTPRFNVGPLLFCWTILSLCILFWYLPAPKNIMQTKHFSMKFIWALWPGSAGGKAWWWWGVCVWVWTDVMALRVKLVKNKLQIPENHKNRPNVLNGFQVLYPSVIVIRYVMLCPLLWLGPLCCVRQTISHVTPRKVHCLPGSHSTTTETKKTWHLMQETQ